MNILFLRGFNNYHKRTIIKYSTLEDYQNNSKSFLNYSAINFNPNDGIVTEYTVGSENQKENSKILMFEDIGAPDYCVCYETDTNNNVTIKSRWFILESQRVRAGQYRLALKRDVIADHLDFLINSDCFMEKAQISNIDSPFLFNNESMTYNQIKKKEVPLYDSTGVAWLVGYIAKSFNGNENNQSFDVTGVIADAQDTNYLDMSETPWGSLTEAQISSGINFQTVQSFNIFPVASWSYGLTTKYTAGRVEIINKDSNYSLNVNYGSAFGNVSGTDGNYIVRDGPYGPGLGIFSGEYQENIQQLIYITLGSNMSATSTFVAYNAPVNSAQDLSTLFATHNSNWLGQAVNELRANSQFNTQGTEYVEKFNGQQVKVGNKYYQIRLTATSNSIGNRISSDVTSITKAKMNIALEEATEALNGGIPVQIINNLGLISIYPVVTTYDVQFREIPASLTVKVTCPNKNDRWPTNDQLFDLFCIPFGELAVDDDVVSQGAVQHIKTRADAALAAARALAIAYGSNLYDLQVLPYCPVKNVRNAYVQSVSRVKEVLDGTTAVVEPYIKTTGAFEIDSDDAGKLGSYQRITDNLTGDVLSYVFWATESHGTFDVNILTTDDCYYQYATAVDSDLLKKKISNETEVFRLCSPNYNGVFEYSAAKNNNTVTGTTEEREPDAGVQFYPDMTQINVDYTYRPGNPYIHLNPKFRGENEGAIYGKDWNDVRGLICGGDFSLGYIIDKFREYQIQNANFQNIFDRQIQNLDVNNQIGKEQMLLSNTMNSLGLPITGGVGGAIAGAKVGGGYGAAIGAVVGTGAGIGGAIAATGLNEGWLQKQQEETKTYSIDMYNYQLGNIKALPYSISRTDCLAENTRLVPFLEVYEATEAEIVNLLKVLKYDGMTLMTIDKPVNYRTGGSDVAVTCHNKNCFYVKGKLIMNPDSEMEDDFHIVDAIYLEFNKGIYLEGV